MNENLLEIKNLKTTFNSYEGKVKAVDDVSFSVKNNRILGIVGESGSGKSITSLSIMRLVPEPHGIIEGGKILFEGNDILKLSQKEMCLVRGNKISMVFQEPMTALNPVFTVGKQIGEVLKIHNVIDKKDEKNKIIELLKLVQISRPEKIIDEYPFQLSGGMRQRVMIAIAIACNPKLIIADEPTTALDVTIQAQILELLKQLTKKLNTSIMLITHDLGVIAEMAQDVIVMYCGKIVEECSAEEFFENALHPYSIGLIKSRPDNRLADKKFYSIPGMVPSPYNMPKGCAFYPRCEHCMPICKEKMPDLIYKENGHKIRCWIHCEDRGVSYE